MNRSRLCVLFPHLVLGGGETAMMEVAAGLREHFSLAVCALVRRAVTVEASARGELLERFGEVAFVKEREELHAALAGADALLWFGMNPFTPAALEAMPRRPVSVRVVHTSKDEEGIDYDERWRHAIDGVVCVSPEAARRIPRAVFLPNPASPDRLRGERRAFFPPGRMTLGYLGRLFSFKNVSWLIERLQELDCNLLVQAIDTPELTAAELAEKVQELGIGDRVAFLPPQRDVGTLLRSIDALAVLSQQEGFPMAVVEAGWLGVPVLATRVGALPELFADEIAFVELEGGLPSLASLRDALARVQTAGVELGRRLCAKVTRLCDPATVAAGYARVLRERIAAREVL
jgi:glycosyltransferase involved in cell wall biosynthesis